MTTESENRDFRVALGRAEVALGSLRLRQGQAAEATEILNLTIGRLQELVKERPQNREGRKWLRQAFRVLAGSI